MHRRSRGPGGRFGVRLTASGWAVLAAALALAFSGMNSGINTMFLMSGLLAALVGVSAVAAWRQVRSVSVARRLPAHVHAGETFTVELAVANRTRRTAYALVVEDWIEGQSAPWRVFAPQVGRRDAVHLAYRARVLHRGVVAFLGVHLSTRFPFGLVRASRTLVGGRERELVVYPALGSVRPSFLEGQMAGVHERSSQQPSRLGLADIHSLREFRAGDNPKWIHWRTSARLGKPVVKEFDREEARRIHIVLDAALPAGSEERARERLEWAASLAATLAAMSARAGRQVGLTAVGRSRTDVPPAAGAAQVRVILEALARLEPADHVGLLEPAFERAALRNTAVILVVTGAGASLARGAVQAWQSPGGSVQVVDASAPTFLEVFEPPAVLRGTVGGPQ